MASRNYSPATEASLFAISLTCYFPQCKMLSVSIFRDKNPQKNVQIAHIVPIGSDEPRYRYLPKSKREGFGNLILLCKPHHDEVDLKENEHTYTEGTLLKWKQENEREVRDKFDSLEGLTRDELDAMLTTAAESTKSAILSSIDDLKYVSENSASLLRELFDQVQNSFLEQETVAMLNAASERLVSLEDTSSTLRIAADKLTHLQDNASTLVIAADKLEAFGNTTGDIAHNSEVALEQIGKAKQEYNAAINQPLNFPDIAASIDSAGDQLLERIGKEIDDLDRQRSPLRDLLKAGLVGFTLGAITVTIAVIVWTSSMPG